MSTWEGGGGREKEKERERERERAVSSYKATNHILKSDCAPFLWYCDLDYLSKTLFQI
jgi:hypothetical protein